MAWPFDPALVYGAAIWPLQIFSMTFALVAVAGASTPRQGAALAFAFAWAWIAASVWWLFISMHRYGGLPAWMAALAVALLAAFLASFLAAAGGVWVWFLRQKTQEIAVKPAQAAAFFVALFVMAEQARHSWLTGFPWGAAGYAHIDGPLASLAPYVGVYGMGAAAAGLCAWLALMLRAGRVTSAGLGAAVYLLCAWALPAPGEPKLMAAVSVRLLQGNIAQDEKFDALRGVQTSMRHYGQVLHDLPRAASPTLVVTPETALPIPVSMLGEDALASITAPIAQSPHAALIGVFLGDAAEGWRNGVMGVHANASAADTRYLYSKHHLVPFGEFVPSGFRWFTRMMSIPLGDQEAGAVAQPSMLWQGVRWAPNICYEDLFGDELARRFAHEGSAPHVMVNASNIAWFGESVAVAQHLNLSRMRAMELARPMLRATNTGATAVIDHRGRLQASLTPHTLGVLDTVVRPASGPPTPYAYWASRSGHWPLWGAAVMLLAAIWLSRWQARRQAFTPQSTSR